MKKLNEAEILSIKRLRFKNVSYKDIADRLSMSVEELKKAIKLTKNKTIKNRKSGYYWIQYKNSTIKNQWVILFWNGAMWYDKAHTNDIDLIIDETMIERTDGLHTKS